MTISSNKHKRQTITNYKQHKSIVPHDSTKPPKNPRTSNACTYHPGTHTPCTHAHTNNNPSDQAHPHTYKNDTNSCKLFQFVRNSYEIRTKFVTTTFTVRIEGRNSYEIRTKFVRNSHEFRTNFVRTSYESRTIFAGHWQKSHTNTTYACTGVPTPTHISLYLPPRHPHTHTVQQCTHMLYTHPLLRGSSPLYEIKSTPFAHGGPPEHLGDLQMWPLGTTPPHSFVGRPH